MPLVVLEKVAPLKKEHEFVSKIKKVKTVTFVDLFSGIGGFHLGIKYAAKSSGFDAKCVLAVDINERARATYSRNFTDTSVLNDVTDIEVTNKIPRDVDIVCGGFPCQPFSLAGKKLGVDDDRGTLFRHIARILKEKKPKAVFLENVRNLTNIKDADGESTLETIKKALSAAGYPVQMEIFRATDFGLPTHRPRIYLVGFRKDILPDPAAFIWPKETHEKPVTLKKYFKSLSGDWKGLVKKNGWPNRVGNTIRVGGVGSGFRNKNGVLVRDRRNWDSYMFYEDDKLGSKRKKPHSLSVDEAKAMMGFPHDFKFPPELSSLHAMRQLGNSVAVPVIEAIAGSIIRVIHGGQNNS